MSSLYLEAGRVVNGVLQENLGLKAALYRDYLKTDPRAVCKLAAATLGHRDQLRGALRACGLLLTAGGSAPSEAVGKKDRKRKRGDDAKASEPIQDEGVAMVMTYDLLVGRGVQGGGRLKRELLAHKSKLLESFKAAMAQQVHNSGIDASKADPCSIFAELPRYVRINRLLVPEKAAVVALRKNLTETLSRKVKESNLPEPHKDIVEVVDDKLVPNLLKLNAKSRSLLQGIPEVDSGKLVLQDRSSCLGALAASLTPGTVVLDACSAPGSKTTHAIELLQGRGRMIACERNPKRAGSLVSRLKQLCALQLNGKSKKIEDGGLKLGSTLQLRADNLSVEVRVGDFLKCNPQAKPFCDVEVLLVDPSCSGSGLPEHHLLDAPDEGDRGARLKKLAAFQRRILSHALHFPRARTIVYSTCSVHQEENEDVVEEVLNSQASKCFEVVEALPWWKSAVRDGSADMNSKPAWARHCIHCNPTEHKCRGFFLCRLDRIPGTYPQKIASEDAPNDKQVPRRKRRRVVKRKSAAADLDAGSSTAVVKHSQAVPPMCGSGGQGAKRAKKGGGVRIFAGSRNASAARK
eukprot:TRINITY_DN5351_c0_g3_i1.p1 TRINITY_DN5351_c0_g3~~TRINITY_DN5351_c0_g3_i1.p1  ORF type:complete len:577 (-),score=79.80 TRINITY_DN5351_c0_g3_i1:74-1804(-)